MMVSDTFIIFYYLSSFFIIIISDLYYIVHYHVGNDRGQSTAEYFSDLTRRVENANYRALSSQSHEPEYPDDLVEAINAVHERDSEVEVVNVNNFMDDSDDDDSVDGEIARVAGQNYNEVDHTILDEVDIGTRATNPNNLGHNTTTEGRKLPFPSVNLEEGRITGYQMMREAKRLGWDNSLKHGKRSAWLKEKSALWFGFTGIFRMYKPVNHSRLSVHINALIKYAKEKFPSQNHSNDSTGVMGEDIPPYVLICREFEEHKASNPSSNVQQQANRFVSAVIQQTMMEPGRQLGEMGTSLRSQVRDENPPSSINNLPTASNLMRDRTQITGLIDNAGVPSGATSTAATGVSAAMTGMASVSRRDVISHIELSRERQSERLCQSLGSVLNTILHPPRTISDINSDFRDASIHFENASNETMKAYWSMAMSKLMDELQNV